jgi:hypothetical protein
MPHVIGRPALVGGILVLIGTGAACTRSATSPTATTTGISLNVVSGNTQSGPVNARLPNAIRVQVLNNVGQPVPNFLLDFVVTSGGGSVFGGGELTDAQGYADEQWTLGPRLGPQTLQAREVNPNSGVAASYGNFTAIGTPPNTVMVVTTSGPTGLAVMNADGSGLKSINIGSLKAGDPALSADHTHVLFDNSAAYPVGGIYEVNVNGTGLTQTFQSQPNSLPNGQGTSLFTFSDPMWDPDGVNYVVDYVTETGTGDIATGPFYPGSGINCLGDPTQVSYSPDGEKYLFIATNSFIGVDCTPGATDIFVEDVNDNGGGVVQLTTGGSDPAWSPDGKLIALTYNGHTSVMDPDGNNVKPTAGAFGLVSWSPDSQLWAVDSGYVNSDGTNYMAVKGCPCRFAWR